MTTPTNLTTCTMTGLVVDDLGVPMKGICQIVPSIDRMTTEGSDMAVLLAPQVFVLDGKGGFSVDLVASVGSDDTPLDVVWTLILPANDQNNVSSISFLVPVGVPQAKVSEHVITTGNARSLYFRGGLWSRI